MSHVRVFLVESLYKIKKSSEVLANEKNNNRKLNETLIPATTGNPISSAFIHGTMATYTCRLNVSYWELFIYYVCMCLNFVSSSMLFSRVACKR